MNNTDKLLRAFIDASGYEIEEVDISPMKHDRYPHTPIIDYKVTKKQVDIINIPNSKKLTKECIEEILNPNKPVGGVIMLRYEND